MAEIVKQPPDSRQQGDASAILLGLPPLTPIQIASALRELRKRDSRPWQRRKCCTSVATTEATNGTSDEEAEAVTYFRVSTGKQGKSGLGLEAQRRAVDEFLRNNNGELIGKFVEVESGKLDQRPQLLEALAHCDLTGATPIVAKLDRLSRNVAFLATLQDSGTKFLAVDIPEANELTIHIIAAVTQAERKAISKRTKEALDAAKARGIKLGGARGNLLDLRRGPEVPAGRRTPPATRTRRRQLTQELV